MNILGGVLPADRGEIVIDGAAVHFRTPSDSLSAGVAFIHQELSLINDLAIYENMFIGHELRKKNRFLDSAAMIAKTNEVSKKWTSISTRVSWCATSMLLISKLSRLPAHF